MYNSLVDPSVLFTVGSKEQLDCPPPSSSLSAGATPSPSPVNPWPQISDEHCYPKLMAQWTNLEHPLPIQHIFHEARTIIPPAENGYEGRYEWGGADVKWAWLLIKYNCYIRVKRLLRVINMGGAWVEFMSSTQDLRA